MNSPTTYRVVGVRANGEESIVSHHLSIEAAERVVRMIRLGSPLQEVRIESEQVDKSERDGESPNIHKLPENADLTSESD